MEGRYSQNIFSRRSRYEHLRAQLDDEQASFVPHWTEITDYMSPRRPRFSLEDNNRGDRRNTKIRDITGTFALRTLRSGMMAGITNPARPWFKLSASDYELEKNEAVKMWLHRQTKRMSSVFLKSNLYNVLPNVYTDMGSVGTSAVLVEEDFDEVVRFYQVPLGEFKLANDEKMRVRVFMREFKLTVRQVVSKYGVDPRNPGKINWDNISAKVKNLYENGNQEAWVYICHVIEPNLNYDPEKLESKYKKYVSVYYEKGFAGRSNNNNYMWGADQHKFLSEQGYDYFPILAPRWSVLGSDVYATDCPGMDALGDIKQLQAGEKRSLQGIEKNINPPLKGPASLRGKRVSSLPGDITYTDDTQGLSSLYDIRFDVNGLEQKQQQVRQRISKAFYEDLFLMLANSDRRQITATEIEERHEEKLLALGPVLEQLNQDLLDPLIDIVFTIMEKQGLIEEPPEELSGKDLKVEYVSIMAQAQKLVGLGAHERFMGIVGQVASFNPDVLKKVDVNTFIDEVGEITSVAPGIVRPTDVVEAEKAAEKQAMQQQMQMEQLGQAAQAANQLASADVDGENALTAIAGGLS
jgi:hypothetical protein